MTEPINLPSAILRVCVERPRQDRLHPRESGRITFTEEK